MNDKELHHPDASSDEPFSLRVRIVQYIFVFLGVILTLALAWWQWTTWQSSGGTFQNLGYAIQWPIFGAFLVFGYRKYIQYERDRLLGDDQAAVSKKLRTEMTEIPDDFLADVTKSDHTAADVSQSDVDDDRRRRARRASSSSSSKRIEPEMLAKRIIPCLDVDAGRVVKGIRFLSLRDAGDPVEQARRYDEQGADELVFLDITASADKRAIVADLVRRAGETIEPDGDLVLVHWLGETDYPLSGDAAAEGFIRLAAPFAHVLHQAQTPDYRIDILRAGGPA